MSEGLNVFLCTVWERTEEDPAETERERERARASAFSGQDSLAHVKMQQEVRWTFMRRWYSSRGEQVQARSIHIVTYSAAM